MHSRWAVKLFMLRRNLQALLNRFEPQCRKLRQWLDFAKGRYSAFSRATHAACQWWCLRFGIIGDRYIKPMSVQTMRKVRGGVLECQAAMRIAWRLAILYYQKWFPSIYAQLRQYALLIRLHRPIGIMLLLWPTLWALWIAADGFPAPKILCIFIAGVFLMRSAGVIMNDLADRKFDGYVARTRDRPLVTHSVTTSEAVYLLAVLLFFAILLVLQLNILTCLLACVALILAASYPFMKRFTWLPQFYLGISFSWSIPMAFAAQTGSIPNIAWALVVVNILWVVYYDTIYALIDRPDDLKIGIKSTAILCMGAEIPFLLILLGMIAIAMLIIANTLQWGNWVYAALVCALGLNVWQVNLLCKGSEKLYMRVFLSNNAWGALIFAGIALHYSRL